MLPGSLLFAGAPMAAAGAMLVVGLDRAVQAVRLVVRPRGEVQGRRRTGRRAVAKADAPQPVDHQRMAVCGLEVTAGLPAVAGPGKRVDPPVAEVAHEEVAAELAEAWIAVAVGQRRPGETPRRVQRAARCHAAH